jgi:hypothetical protein
MSARYTSTKTHGTVRSMTPSSGIGPSRPAQRLGEKRAEQVVYAV